MILTKVRAICLIALLISGLNGCSSGSSDNSSREYSFGAESFELRDLANGNKELVLGGIGSTAQVSVEGEPLAGNNGFQTELIAEWWDHQAHNFPLSQSAQELSIIEDGVPRTFALARGGSFSYDANSRTFSFEVMEEVAAEPKSQQFARSSIFDRLIAILKHASEPHPAECGIAAPPAIDGLEFVMTNNFRLMWSDRKSGAKLNVTTYTATPPNGFLLIGDFAYPSYSDPLAHGCALPAVRVADGGDRTLIAPPINYLPIWTDKGSGAELDGSFWAMVPPPGYVCPGVYAQNGHVKPFDLFRACFRQDLMEAVTAGPLLWNDRSSGADRDVSLWYIPAREGKYLGFFTATDRYDPPPSAWRFR